MGENIKFGDVIQVDFGDTIGCVQGAQRPAVVVQNDQGNRYSPTTIVIPLSKELKKLNMPVHDVLYKSKTNGLSEDSVILGEQLRVIDKSTIIYKRGYLNRDEIQKVIAVYVNNLPNGGLQYGTV